MKNIERKKSKKAVNAMIEYVLLVSFAIILGIITYQFMRTYVPQEELNCPDGTSIFLKEYNYNCDTGMLTLYLKNTGQFNLGGYFIYATSSEDAKLATIELSKNNTDEIARLNPFGIKFGGIGTDNSLKPNSEEVDVYNLTGVNMVYSIEIVPIRWQEQKNKNVIVSCKDAKIRKTIECNSGICYDLGYNCGNYIIDGKVISCNKAYDPPHSGWSCIGGQIQITWCEAGWDDCDGNALNGCETQLGTDSNCASCGDNCDSGYNCKNNVCTPLPTCDGIWTGPTETVNDEGVMIHCDGTPLPANCNSNCLCDFGLNPNGVGGCWDIGVQYTCAGYCQSLGYTGTFYNNYEGVYGIGGICKQDQDYCDDACNDGTGIIESGWEEYAISNPMWELCPPYQPSETYSALVECCCCPSN